jgi:hypothetical protein
MSGGLESKSEGVSSHGQDDTREAQGYQPPSVKDLGSFVDLTLAKNQHGSDRGANSNG